MSFSCTRAMQASAALGTMDQLSTAADLGQLTRHDISRRREIS
jgi:hypothetical protein